MPYVLMWPKKQKYVARFGSTPAYTTQLANAQIFETRSEAELNREPRSEVVLSLEEARAR